MLGKGRHLMHEIVELTGALSFICMMGAIASGVAFWKFHVRWAGVKVHASLAAAAALFAIAHVIAINIGH